MKSLQQVATPFVELPENTLAFDTLASADQAQITENVISSSLEGAKLMTRRDPFLICDRQTTLAGRQLTCCKPGKSVTQHTL